jgi:ketopantoate reductase
LASMHADIEWPVQQLEIAHRNGGVVRISKYGYGAVESVDTVLPVKPYMQILGRRACRSG